MNIKCGNGIETGHIGVGYEKGKWEMENEKWEVSRARHVHYHEVNWAKPKREERERNN